MVFDKEGRRKGGALLLAVATLKQEMKGRYYRLPVARDYEAIQQAHSRVEGMLAEWDRGERNEHCPVPDEVISLDELRRINVPNYGMTTWGDLFTARQKVALVAISQLIRDVSVPEEFTTAMGSLLGIAFDKTCDLSNALAPWEPDAECPRHMLTRQAIGMAWDFAESVPCGDSSGSFVVAGMRSADALESMVCIRSRLGQVEAADAAAHPLPDQAADIWFTDPPYYDSVPYAHLADFFYVWLRRTVPLVSELFDSENGTTPKGREIVVDRPHRLSTSTKNAESYERGMAEAFAEGRRVLRDDGIGTVVFAHKTTEGWEALLSGMIQGGWTLTGSWPIATEMGTRLNARETASLATSVHLICRPRREDAPTGDWADVLRELPNRVSDWMERLQAEGVRGADLIFACIGPALEIYSRFRVVETAEGEAVGLREYLEKVWEVVGRAALRQVLDEDGRDDFNEALEEDARLTALFLWTLQSTEAQGDETTGEEEGSGRGGYTLPYDVVRRFAQPMGIDLDAATGQVIDQKKGVVHLLSLAERAKVLFGSDDAPTPMEWSATGVDSEQMTLFEDFEAGPNRGTEASLKPPLISRLIERQRSTGSTLEWCSKLVVTRGRFAREVVRRRLFADLGNERARGTVARSYAEGVSSARRDCRRSGSRGQREHDREGEGVPARALRGVLPVPSHDAVCVPAEVARSRAVPADPRGVGDARAMGVKRSAGTVPSGPDRTVDHAGLGTTGQSGVPRGRARATGGVPVGCGH